MSQPGFWDWENRQNIAKRIPMPAGRRKVARATLATSITLCIDVEYGLIRRYAVTAASVHDSQVLGQLLDEDNDRVLQAHSEGSSLRGISRTSGLTYNTGVSLVRAASQQAQLVHNAQVQAVQT